MRRLVPPALIAAAAVLLLWNLGRPALWQDESETALRAESILESGVPRTSLRGVPVTAQPSLFAHEGNAAGVWTWNTWLPAYLAAASFAVLGPTAFAARLPFALAGILALWLWWRLFSSGEDEEAARGAAAEAALALLALSPAFLLFCRQSRYYALVALGNALVLMSWRRLLRGRPFGAPAVALSLNFLLHASFAFFAAAALALGLDALLRRGECLRAGRFWGAAALTAALAAPAAWYFRVWDRPGNHLYAFAESLAFLQTFLLWLAAFAVPLALVAAASARRWALTLAALVLLCGLTGEGPWSLFCAVAVWLWLAAAAARRPAPEGELDPTRACLLLLVATLGLLSFGAAEPYGRYLAGVLPAAAFLAGRAFASAARGRPALVAILAALAVSTNLFHLAPLKAAQALSGAATPADSVSGMMRQRLRDLPARSDLARFAAETARGARGYVEAAADAMRRRGGRTFFSDGDELSLQFATDLRPLLPEEFLRAEPDWILPSPWLKLSPDLDARARSLAASGRYEDAGADAPRLMWQNNPDPLFRDFAPAEGRLPLWRRRDAPTALPIGSRKR